jgi:predicted aminopeptidase
LLRIAGKELKSRRYGGKIKYGQWIDKVMETLDSVGIKLFVLTALKEY